MRLATDDTSEEAIKRAFERNAWKNASDKGLCGAGASG
jgi:hypothetical protein